MTRLLHPVPDAQKVLGGVSRSTIYNLVARGELEFVHIGRRALVTDESLRAFVDRLRTPAGTAA